MSSTATPITPARFAEAISNLPLSSLFAKAAEIRNSTAYLRRSNEELVIEANTGDEAFVDALAENIAVISRMQERLELLKTEIERRGYILDNGKVDGSNNNPVASENGTAHAAGDKINGLTDIKNDTRAFGLGGKISVRGTVTNEELERLVAERLSGNVDVGVHL